MSLAQLLDERKLKPIPNQERVSSVKGTPVWEDPRPDLKEDHELWNRLLLLATTLPDRQQAWEVTQTLNGMRCGGTLLKRGRTSYLLRPLVDKRLGWDTEQDYEEVRDRFLKPHLKTITELLKTLWRDDQ